MVVGTITFVSGVFSPMAIVGEIFFLTIFFTAIGFIPPVPLDVSPAKPIAFQIAKWFIATLIGLLGFGYIILEFKK